MSHLISTCMSPVCTGRWDVTCVSQSRVHCRQGLASLAPRHLVGRGVPSCSGAAAAAGLLGAEHPSSVRGVGSRGCKAIWGLGRDKS